MARYIQENFDFTWSNIQPIPEAMTLEEIIGRMHDLNTMYGGRYRAVEINILHDCTPDYEE